MVLQDSLLHRNWEPGDGLHLQLVVPYSVTHDVLTALHMNLRQGTLHGIRRTRHRVRQWFYWPGVSRDVEEWCRRCELCASRKSEAKPAEHHY